MILKRCNTRAIAWKYLSLAHGSEIELLLIHGIEIVLFSNHGIATAMMDCIFMETQSKVYRYTQCIVNTHALKNA